MEANKEVKFLGGALKFVPAGSYVDEQTGQEKNYEARVKVYDGSRSPVALSVDAARALVEAVRDSDDLQVFLGV